MIRSRAWTLLVIVFALFGGQVQARPPLWIVHGRHATIYLFGSVHILPSGLDWAPPELLAALPKAREIWFELPIDRTTDIAAANFTRTLGYLPRGDTLASHLTPDEAARLRRVAAKLSLDATSLEPLRPWLAEVTLSLMVDERAGATASRGVEQQLQGLAPSSARRRAFETAREQIGFLADASLADQIASLDATLHEIEEDPGAYGRVLDGWMSGDLNELEVDALQPLRRASPALYRRLITDRNERWATRVRERLAGRGIVVMVVGMGHLIGAEGVPAQLRAAGVSVEGP